MAEDRHQEIMEVTQAQHALEVETLKNQPLWMSEEYPVDLCKVLGTIFVESQPSAAETIPIPEWFVSV